MSRGKSLKIKKNDVDSTIQCGTIQYNVDSGESNLSSINTWDATEEKNNSVNQTVRIHNGQEGLDVVIDNSKKRSRSPHESFQLTKTTSVKFDSQLSSMTTNSQYGSMITTEEEKKIEVMT
jgi:hypothetical protein